MENVKIIENAEQQPDIVADEKENFDAFISAMVQIVEKYGKSVLQDLDCVAYISHFSKLSEVTE